MIKRALGVAIVLTITFSCNKEAALTSTSKVKSSKKGEVLMDSDSVCAICKKWIHVVREDEKHLAIYKTEDQNFIPVRGLEAMVFMDNGIFRYYVNGKSDRPFIYAGKWKYNLGNDKIINISWPKGKFEAVKINDFPTEIEIVELGVNTLKIKK